jgi:phage-related minor tail protein
LAPIALATAAVGALGVAYYKGTKEQDEYSESLIATGNYAGVSAGQLGDMARQVGATVGTTGQAAEVLALLAGNGKIAGESFLGITQAAVSMREATGKAVKETVAEFEKIADEPVKASAALNEQYHYLTASVYSQIIALEKQGDHAGAVKLATEQYADAINERTPRILENLSFWEKGYNAVARAADSLKNLGRPDIDADIDQARRNLEQAQSGNVGAFQNQKEMVELYSNQLNMLEDQKAAAEDIAKWEGEQAKAQRDAVTAMGKVDALTKSSWTNEQKRADALKEYKRQLDDIRKVSPNDARLNQRPVQGSEDSSRVCRPNQLQRLEKCAQRNSFRLQKRPEGAGCGPKSRADFSVGLPAEASGDDRQSARRSDRRLRGGNLGA